MYVSVKVKRCVWMAAVGMLAGAAVAPSTAAKPGTARAAAAEAPPIIVTQQQALLVLDPKKPVWDFKRDPASVFWDFDPRRVPGYENLNPAKNWSKGPNEAKVYRWGGKTYVATVTGKGFAAVVKYPSKEPYWKTAKLITPDDTYAYNPHGIELLPTGEVAVANSGHSATGQARENRNVCLFPRGSDTASSCLQLLAAHGVHWDAKRKRLWALGGDQLKAYRIDRGTPGKPKLVEDTTLGTTVPWGSGHDLGAVPGSDRLWVVTGTPVFQYDIELRRWYGDTGKGAQEEYPGWREVSVRGTKAVQTDPVSGQVISNVAENSEQTTHTVSRHFPENRHELKWDGNNSYFYKARWFRPITIE